MLSWPLESPSRLVYIRTTYPLLWALDSFFGNYFWPLSSDGELELLIFMVVYIFYAGMAHVPKFQQSKGQRTSIGINSYEYGSDENSFIFNLRSRL